MIYTCDGLAKRRLLATSITISVLVLLSALFIASTSRAPLAQVEEKREITVPEVMRLRVETNKQAYPLGEPIKSGLFLENLGTEPLQKPSSSDVSVLDSSGQEIRGMVKTVQWVSEASEVQPSQEAELSILLSPWNQMDWQGKQVPAGVYTINITVYGRVFVLRVTIGWLN